MEAFLSCKTYGNQNSILFLERIYFPFRNTLVFNVEILYPQGKIYGVNSMMHATQALHDTSFRSTVPVPQFSFGGGVLRLTISSWLTLNTRGTKTVALMNYFLVL